MGPGAEHARSSASYPTKNDRARLHSLSRVFTIHLPEAILFLIARQLYFKRSGHASLRLLREYSSTVSCTREQTKIKVLRCLASRACVWLRACTIFGIRSRERHDLGYSCTKVVEYSWSLQVTLTRRHVTVADIQSLYTNDTTQTPLSGPRMRWGYECGLARTERNGRLELSILLARTVPNPTVPRRAAIGRGACGRCSTGRMDGDLGSRGLCCRLRARLTVDVAASCDVERHACVERADVHSAAGYE